MEKFNNIRGCPVDVNLIRTVAIVGVVLLHASGQYLITAEQLGSLSPSQLVSWGFVSVYQSIAVTTGVPLFLMLTGALLLEPTKKESLKVFFRKRWVRIGLPLIFWGAIYFVWDFTVRNLPFSGWTILQGILNGPYSQFWYMYVLIGLYLLTPILRVFIANAEQVLVKYFLLIWVIGVAVLPCFLLITPFALNANVFVLTGYVGYFVFGTYLFTVKIDRKKLVAFTALGLALTALATYVLAAADYGSSGSSKLVGMYFFQEYISPTVIFASVMLFLLLLTVKPPAPEQAGSVKNRLIKLFGENTLAIFFVHVIVLESIQEGFLGFTLNRTILDPIVEVPLISVVVLFVSLAIVWALKKVPGLKNFIG
ncbi:MAG: acyltransferase [Candidatus Bathyarchaeia archaeon]|jgi:surface polysaccharide O-acyltransferase-like enzyme